MFLDKIRRRESGILLYGITPPKAETPFERVCEIAAKNIGRIAPQDIDALIVYDVQDEAERTTAERPFPFSSSLDPLQYATQHLQSLAIPKIIYRYYALVRIELIEEVFVQFSFFQQTYFVDLDLEMLLFGRCIFFINWS